jgi:2',3'-cyclic-nucleotide 2'-phosphodiesterase (5'-nucleotidase family)
MAKVCWIVTIAIAVNVAVIGSLFFWDRQKFFGWLLTFEPPIIHIIHFNDEYDIMKSPKWVEKVLNSKTKETITVFSGDIMSPSILASVMKGSQFKRMLELVGMDYAVPGNHEVDFGVQDFKNFWTQNAKNTHWLVANMHHADDFFDSIPKGKPLGDIQEWAIREQHGLKIGFFGIVDEEWMNNFPGGDKGERTHFTYTPFLEVARSVSQHLRSLGCDLVFVITHMSTAHDRELLLDPEVKIDIVFGGHDHVYYLQRYGSKLLIKSGSDFDQFSNLYLQFTNELATDETKVEYLEVKMGPESTQRTEGSKADPKAAAPEQPKPDEKTPAKKRVLEDSVAEMAPATEEEAIPEEEAPQEEPAATEVELVDEAAEELSNFKINKWKHYQYQYDEIESISGDNNFVFSLLLNGKYKYLRVRVEMLTVNYEKDPDNAEMVEYIDKDIYPRIREYMTNVMQIADRMDAREASIMARESEVGDLIADILRTDHKVDISIINSGSIKSEAFFRPKFFFVQKDIRKMFSRDSKMLKVELSGSDILQVMEVFFEHLPAPNGNFICFGGVKMKVDPNQPPGSRIVEGSVMMGEEPFDLELVYTVVILDFLWSVVTEKRKLPVTDHKQFQSASDELKRPIDSLQIFLEIPQNPDYHREFKFFKRAFPDMTVDQLIAMEKVSLEKTINTFSEDEVGFTPEKQVLTQATNTLLRRLKFYSLAADISEEREIPVFVIRPTKDDRLVLVPIAKPAAPGVLV